jgi:hypothetical protein
MSLPSMELKKSLYLFIIQQVMIRSSVNQAVSLILVIFIAFLMFSCAAVYHGLLMKGSIIEASDSDVYLCIGSKDGATVGQELDVYKVIRVARARPATFRREYAGKVKITEIIDEHFAKATVISGKAEKYDIVELVSPK